MSQTRRLAAILAADVAGYSRLMGTPRPRGEGGAGTEFCLRMLQLTRSLVKGAAANPKRTVRSNRPYAAASQRLKAAATFEGFTPR